MGGTEAKCPPDLHPGSALAVIDRSIYLLRPCHDVSYQCQQLFSLDETIPVLDKKDRVHVTRASFVRSSYRTTLYEFNNDFSGNFAMKLNQITESPTSHASQSIVGYVRVLYQLLVTSNYILVGVSDSSRNLIILKRFLRCRKPSLHTKGLHTIMIKS